MTSLDPALESEYNARARVPEHPAIFERWRIASDALCVRTDADLDVAYGPHPLQRMDLFRAAGARGTVVFIHGGYWRSLDKADFAFVAAPFLACGLSVATFNYRLCPAASIGEIIADCEAALAWLLANGPKRGLPADQVALTGHSAGAHLVSMLFATDWPRHGIVPECVVGGAALSGVFDLEPLVHCSMNAELRLDAMAARAVSPIHYRCRLPAPLYLAAGANETAAFREQTQLLPRAWPANCDRVEEIAGCNHFTIVDEFARPASSVFQYVQGLFH
jgi:arylformamidase